jgi:hypothetical protein
MANATPQPTIQASPMMTDGTLKGMSPGEEAAYVGHRDTWEGYGGIPRTAKFLAFDPEMKSIIFRRFHELSIRNLLYLENRVAALQEWQQKLDEADRKMNDADVFKESDEDIKNAEKSWEEFAVLGTRYWLNNRSNIPISATKW